MTQAVEIPIQRIFVEGEEVANPRQSFSIFLAGDFYSLEINYNFYGEFFSLNFNNEFRTKILCGCNLFRMFGSTGKE